MQRRHLVFCAAATGILSLVAVLVPIPPAASQEDQHNGPLVYLRNFAGDQFVLMRSAAGVDPTPHGYVLRLQGSVARQAVNQQISRQMFPDPQYRFDASLLDPAGTWVNLSGCRVAHADLTDDSTTLVEIEGERLADTDTPLARIPAGRQQEI